MTTPVPHSFAVHGISSHSPHFSKSPAGDIMGDNTCDNMGDNMGDNTGDNTGDNMGDNT